MKLTRDRINCFLLGFNKSCKNNVEYSEYSNEVLFKLIFNYPKEVIDILSKDANIDKTYIYDELSHPLLDNPSINDIIKKIKNVNTANVTKKELINALTKATLELDY